MNSATSSSAGAPLFVKALLPLLAAAALFAATWFIVVRFAPADRWGQILVGAVAFVVGALVLGRLVKNRPDLKMPMRIGVIAAALIALSGLYLTAFRDDVVNEDVAVAAPRAVATPAPEPDDAANAVDATSGAAAAEKPEPKPQPAPKPAPKENVELATGSFRGVDGHDGRGSATVIKLAEGGRVVTFTDFDIDNGPGVKVYLSPSEAYTDDVVLLGDLKGNVGNQQYEIPDGVDLSTYGTVLLWCSPFSVRMAVASLA